MDAEIFRDLKQLDERLHTVASLLESCTNLFHKHYQKKWKRQEAFSWPYAVQGKDAKPKWPEYPKFKSTRYISPSTTALVGWAASRLAAGSSDVQKELGVAAAEAAKKLASLSRSRMKSKTFTLIGEIFLHAQVLRFLASQAQFRRQLFRRVFFEVRHALDDPGELHPFFLHYCVLAWEQIRGPSLRLADSLIVICELAHTINELTRKRQDPFLKATNALLAANGLRDSLESLATVVSFNLRQPKLGRRLDNLALRTETVIFEITTAITQNQSKDLDKARSSLQRILKASIRFAGKGATALPSEIIGKRKPTTSAGLWAAADQIKNYPWYSEVFVERLGREIAEQVSFASSLEQSRLDIGSLAYSLAAVSHCDPLRVPTSLAKKALSLVIEHQRDGRWSEIQPISRMDVGFVHYPLNIEIANAVLSILLNGPYIEGSFVWSQIDEVMDWVGGSLNRVGKDSGWSSEHDYAPDRIDLWATAQVAQFLLDYRAIRSRLVVRSALDRAGLITTRPNSVETPWKKLSSTDLEQPYAEQVKSKLREQFVTPNERGKTPKSSSVLLYGPPGTSKTSLMEALANRLQWGFLQIAPADFLLGGGEQVEARATLVFEILKRAENLVILFDEVDEFLLDREAKDRPEGIFRFMTTSMLPKLQSLKSQKSLIFGIATNYKERLDKAITRAGRVDHDWAILPPDFTSRTLLIRGFSENIERQRVRSLAVDTPFFSFPELKRVVAGNLITKTDPWKIVRHPTASPEAYANRPGLAEEFPSLVDAQISPLAINRPGPKTKKTLADQLKGLRKTKGLEVDKKESSELERTTAKSIDEAILKLNQLKGLRKTKGLEIDKKESSELERTTAKSIDEAILKLK